MIIKEACSYKSRVKGENMVTEIVLNFDGCNKLICTQHITKM